MLSAQMYEGSVQVLLRPDTVVQVLTGMYVQHRSLFLHVGMCPAHSFLCFDTCTRMHTCMQYAQVVASGQVKEFRHS